VGGITVFACPGANVSACGTAAPVGPGTPFRSR
jgi:hypothetical protein